MVKRRKRRRGFEWNPQRKKAAELIAKGHTQSEAARRVGVTPTAVSLWMKRPEFVDRVDQLTYEYGHAKKTARIRAYNQIIEEGVNTILKKLKETSAWKGKNLDGLLREIREYMKQVAQEVGDLSQDGTNINVGVGVQNNIGLEELSRRYQHRLRMVERVSTEDFRPTLQDMEDFMVEERLVEQEKEGG